MGHYFDLRTRSLIWLSRAILSLPWNCGKMEWKRVVYLVKYSHPLHFFNNFMAVVTSFCPTLCWLSKLEIVWSKPVWTVVTVNSMHFWQSSNNDKYLYLLLFQSHCRWDSLFQTCLSFPVFQSRFRMRLSILEGDTYRTGVRPLSVEQQKVFYNNDMYVSDNIWAVLRYYFLTEKKGSPKLKKMS